MRIRCAAMKEKLIQYTIKLTKSQIDAIERVRKEKGLVTTSESLRYIVSEGLNSILRH